MIFDREKHESRCKSGISNINNGGGGKGNSSGGKCWKIKCGGNCEQWQLR